MEQDAVRHADFKQFHPPVEIACAHCDEVGLYRVGTAENKGDWVLGFAQRPDGGSISWQQGAATLDGWANSIHYGLTEFDVPLQVGCLGHSMYKHHVVRPVK
jgi:hypothetical protein